MTQVRLSADKVREGIYKDLQAICSEKILEGQKRYFKEQVTFLGCSLSQCNQLSRTWAERLMKDGYSYDDTLLIAEELLKAGTFEEGAVGLDLVTRLKRDFRESDLTIFEG